MEKYIWLIISKHKVLIIDLNVGSERKNSKSIYTSTEINIYCSFSSTWSFYMFSANCARSSRVHPARWRWHSKLRCFVQWLSWVLCSMVSFCWLMLHRLVTLHVQLCLGLLFVLQCTSSMGCRSFRDVPTPFWHEKHPKNAYSGVSPYCLSGTPLAVLIRHPLAGSSKKFFWFFPLELKQISA